MSVGTLSEKFPSMSVTVPMLVPGTITVAPMMASPSSSEMTLPVTVLVVCAINIDKLRTSMAMIDKSFLIIDTLIIFIEHLYDCFDKKSLVVQLRHLSRKETFGVV